MYHSQPLTTPRTSMLALIPKVLVSPRTTSSNSSDPVLSSSKCSNHACLSFLMSGMTSSFPDPIMHTTPPPSHATAHLLPPNFLLDKHQEASRRMEELVLCDEFVSYNTAHHK
eukprot:762561-Hanusia_phi.AAC.9